MNTILTLKYFKGCNRYTYSGYVTRENSDEKIEVQDMLNDILQQLEWIFSKKEQSGTITISIEVEQT